MDNQVSPEAKAVDEIFHYHPAPGQVLDPEEARLAGQILDLAGPGLPVDERFYRALQQKLLAAAAARRKPRLHAWPRMLLSGAGALALLALAFLGGRLILQSLGRSHQPAAQPVSPAVTAAAVTGTTAGTLAAAPALTQAATSTATPQPLDTPTALPGGAGDLILTTALPAGPQSVPAYTQVQAGNPLTPQTALAMAERLGVKGSVYQYAGEGGGTVYTVADRSSTIIFFGATDLQFSYFVSSAAMQPGEGSSLAFEQQSQIAVDWLKARGLLDFPYQVEPLAADPTGVAIVQRLDSGSLYINNLYDPWISVRIDAKGQVFQVIYHSVNTTTAERISLRPAAEAWQELAMGSFGRQVFFQTLSFNNRRSLRTWFRARQAGEKIDLYGYASVIQAVDPSQPPRVEVANVALDGGSPDLLRQIPMHKLLHVWGIYQADAASGAAWLEPQGWEYSSAEDVHLGGEFAQGSGGLQFVDEQNQAYTLPELPAGLPAGEKVSVSGVKGKPGEIDWQVIQTQLQEDENVSFGSVSAPAQPEPSTYPIYLPPTGRQPVDRVEGLTGTVQSTFYQQPDGSGKLVNRVFFAENLPDGSLGWNARLSGEPAQEVSTYHNLPIKIWGTYQVVDNEIILVVDRYEPAWPGVKIKAWFGKVSEKVLEGKNVFILTEDGGQQWVVSNTIRFPQTLAQFGWEAGAQIVVEGYPSQTQKTFGGLPVLENFSLGILGIKGNTRETYQLSSSQPRIEAAQAPENKLPGKASVEKVELVYYAVEFQGGVPPQGTEPRRLKPFWRFSGHLEDGRPFEILVPAERAS